MKWEGSEPPGPWLMAGLESTFWKAACVCIDVLAVAVLWGLFHNKGLGWQRGCPSMSAPPLSCQLSHCQETHLTFFSCGATGASRVNLPAGDSWVASALGTGSSWDSSGTLQAKSVGLRGQIKDISHNQVYLGTQGSHSPFHSTPVLQIAANQSGVKHFYLFFLIQRLERFFLLYKLKHLPRWCFVWGWRTSRDLWTLFPWQFRGSVGLWVAEKKHPLGGV